MEQNTKEMPFSKKVGNGLSTRISLTDRAPTPPTANPNPTQYRWDWADIKISKVLDYSIPLAREEDGDKTPTKPLLTVSENTAKALKGAFSRPLSNQ